MVSSQCVTALVALALFAAAVQANPSSDPAPSTTTEGAGDTFERVNEILQGSTGPAVGEHPQDKNVEMNEEQRNKFETGLSHLSDSSAHHTTNSMNKFFMNPDKKAAAIVALEDAKKGFTEVVDAESAKNWAVFTLFIVRDTMKLRKAEESAASDVQRIAEAALAEKTVPSAEQKQAFAAAIDKLIGLRR